MILINELEGLTRRPKDGGNKNETCIKLPESSKMLEKQEKTILRRRQLDPSLFIVAIELILAL